jgi:hypothetical protein
VHAEVGLRIAVQAEAPRAHGKEHRILEDPGADLAAAMGHRSQEADLDGEELHNR